MKKPTEDEGSGEKLMNQSEVKNLMRQIWSNDKDVLSRLFGSFMTSAVKTEWPTDSFFIERLLVPPTRIRPVRNSLMAFRIKLVCMAWYGFGWR